MNALGYVTRSLNIKTHDSDYGGVGRAHAVTEVWSNALDKWVLLDPQFSIYAEYHDEPLNYYEIYRRFKDVEFKMMRRKLAQLEANATELIEEYKGFLADYFGFMKINVDSEGITAGLTLHLDQPEQQLAFQAMELDSAIFTNRVEDLYFSLNHTLILFEYKKKVDFEKIIKDHEDHLQTEEDFKANLHLFAAEPDFTVRLRNNMPWFSHYEIQLDNEEPFNSNQSSFEWKLKEGMNVIRVCSVNSQGVKGVPTEMKISYQ